MQQYDEAIEIAADHLQRKETKHHRKQNHFIEQQQQQQGQKKQQKDQQQQQQQHQTTSNHKKSYEENCCVGIKLEVEEGKTSPIIKSPMANRKLDRREGVAEKNNTERKLVKESVKVMARTTNLNDFNLL